MIDANADHVPLVRTRFTDLEILAAADRGHAGLVEAADALVENSDMRSVLEQNEASSIAASSS